MLGFAVAVCVAASAALAVTSTLLRPIQAAAEEFDRQLNVMFAVGLVKPGDLRPRKELEELYRQRVEESVLEVATGEVHKDLAPADVAAMRSADERNKYRIIAVAKDEAGQAESYCLPVAGKGLWSILYGYLALEADGIRVRGITFYKHGETPGLGGEVENPEWIAQWVGKRILDEQGKLVSITVKKGRVDPAVPAEKAHFVDGLSGATITCNGVTRFVKSDLETYRPFLSKIWPKRPG